MTEQTIEHTALYEPLPWQIEAWRDTSPVVLYSGAAGGGKSRAAAEKIHGFCKRYPGAVGIALRKAREYASKSVVYAIKSAVGDDPTVVYNASDLMFRYANGSKIFIAGMKDEGQRQALRSINGDGSADFIWAEEANALTEDDHNELSARLRGRATCWRQLLYTTNPDTPGHWIKQRLMDDSEASIHYSSAKDNPYLPPEYLQTLSSITGVLGLRLRDGLWVQAEGVVYDGFSDSVHVIDAMPHGWQSWRKFRSVDFGLVNPFVCQFWAVDHDGRMYLYRELYMTNRTVQKHAQQIKRLSFGEKYETTVCDHDAEDRATLRENGIATKAAIKDVSRGIQAVQQRLAAGPDGKPRIYFLRNALVEKDPRLVEARKPLSTIQEFPGYVWQTTPDGKPDKEEPMKIDDHGQDCCRYAVAYMDYGQRARRKRSREY